MVEIEPHLNSVSLEAVDVETIVHFIAPWQPVHENREVDE